MKYRPVYTLTIDKTNTRKTMWMNLNSFSSNIGNVYS